MQMSSAGLKFGDQKSTAGFEHSVHLLDSRTLIILRHMVQHERAGQGVECGVREGELLGEGGLETDRYSELLRPSAGEFDHFGRRIDGIDAATR